MPMKVIRMVVRGGSLEPLEPLELAEGIEVSAAIELPEHVQVPRVLRTRHLSVVEPVTREKIYEADEAIARGDVFGPFQDADSAIEALRSAKV